MKDKFKKIKNLLALDIRSDNSFEPNLTSGLLYAAAEEAITMLKPDGRPVKTLELGCGSGVISMMLKKTHGKNVDISMSDIVEASCSDAFHNIEAEGWSADIRCSDLFDRWQNGDQWDVIIYDITGIATKIAAVSPWFTKAFYEGNETGVDHLLRFLKEFDKFLRPDGKIVFPLLSLSDMGCVPNFSELGLQVSLSDRTEWPLPLEEFDGDFKGLAAERNCDLIERDHMLFAWTEVYVCERLVT